MFTSQSQRQNIHILCILKYFAQYIFHLIIKLWKTANDETFGLNNTQKGVMKISYPKSYKENTCIQIDFRDYIASFGCNCYRRGPAILSINFLRDLRMYFTLTMVKPSNCQFVSLGKTLNSHCLRLKSFTNISLVIYSELWLTGSSVWVSSGHSSFLPQPSGKLLNDYEIGLIKDHVP